jgi:hypothetical protein
MECVMGIAAYTVRRLGDGWAVEHDGKNDSMNYLTKEAAFEGSWEPHRTRSRKATR